MDWAKLAAQVALSVGAAFIAVTISALVYLIDWQFIAKRKTKLGRAVKKQVTFDLDKNTSIDAPRSRTSSEGEPLPPVLPKVVASRTFRKAPEEFVHLLERTRLQISQLVSEPQPWKLVHKEGGFEMFTIPQTGLPDRHKAHIVINARAEAVLQCLYEISLRSQWDKGSSGRMVCWYDPTMSVSLYGSPPVNVVSGREFLDLRRLLRLENGYAIISHSVTLPEEPVTPGFVRAFNYPTAQIVLQRDDNCSEVCYVVQTDIKGWIPAKVVRVAMASAISRFMLDLRMFVESNPRLGNFPDLQLNIGKALFDVPPHTFSK